LLIVGEYVILETIELESLLVDNEAEGYAAQDPAAVPSEPVTFGVAV
jgi:hypothetical protein